MTAATLEEINQPLDSIRALRRAHKIRALMEISMLQNHLFDERYAKTHFVVEPARVDRGISACFAKMEPNGVSVELHLENPRAGIHKINGKLMRTECVLLVSCRFDRYGRETLVISGTEGARTWEHFLPQNNKEAEDRIRSIIRSYT